MRLSTRSSQQTPTPSMLRLLPLLALLPLALAATASTNPTKTTSSLDVRSDMYDGLTRPHLPKDKSGVPAFLAHLHAVEMGHSMGGMLTSGSSLLSSMDGAGERRDLIPESVDEGDGISSGENNGKTGAEGENVDVNYDKQQGTTVSVHDLDIQQPSPGRMRRREAKRADANRLARQVIELDEDLYEQEAEPEEPTSDALDNPIPDRSGAIDGVEEGQDRPDSVYRPRQATRAQVIARHKWKMRDTSGTAPQPDHSGAPLTCADYAAYDLRLTQAGTGKTFVVSTSERDASAHLSSTDGSVFKLYEDCELCVAQPGKSGRGLCANISPSRSRAVVYFDTNAEIAMYNYNQATCSISGGGASGPLTCTVPRSPGVNTFCILGDDTLVIRNGPCDAGAGEERVRVIATVR